MNQTLVRYTIADYARFKAAFDADAEDRANNGLDLLQLWREGATAVWALYAARDPARADGYLSGAAATFNAQAGVSAAEIHRLETA